MASTAVWKLKPVPPMRRPSSRKRITYGPPGHRSHSCALNARNASVSATDSWRGHPRYFVTSGLLAYVRKIVPASAGTGGDKTSRAVSIHGGAFTSLPRIGIASVDDPLQAEAIDDHAETRGPEGLLQRHHDPPVLGRTVKEALGFRCVVDVERQ